MLASGNVPCLALDVDTDLRCRFLVHKYIYVCVCSLSVHVYAFACMQRLENNFSCHSSGALCPLLKTVLSLAWSTPRDPPWPGLQAWVTTCTILSWDLDSNQGLQGKHFTDWATSLTLVVSILGWVTWEKPLLTFDQKPEGQGASHEGLREKTKKQKT